MDPLVELSQKPTAREIYLLAGWQQWADAGAISSGLPEYLVEHTHASVIGEIKPDGFYFFQVPGTHHLFRPNIRLDRGVRAEIELHRNEFYYTGDDDKGLVIFTGEEPHMNAERYASAFFDVVKELGVRSVAALGGVYGAMPYDKEREISCAYSLSEMRAELEKLEVRFSNYEGGATIGTFLVSAAEALDVKMVDFYAFVPAYDFSSISEVLEGIRIEYDFKAWYDLMRRVNYLFEMNLDLSELAVQSETLITAMDTKIEELDRKVPEAKLRDYLAQVTSEFSEASFMPLDDVWERELGDLFDDLDD